MSTIVGKGIAAGSGGGELNIAYGLTPPADTSKLWVRIEDKPNSVTVQAVTPFGNEAVTAYGVRTPEYTGAQGLAYCNGSLYIFEGYNVRVYKDGVWNIFLTISSNNANLHYTAPSVVVGKKILRLFGHNNGGYTGSAAGQSYSNENILIVDTETKTYSQVDVSGITSNCQLGNAAVVGTKLYFTAGQSDATGTTAYKGSSHIYEIDSDNPTTATDIGYFFTTSADMRGASVVAAGNKLYAKAVYFGIEGSVPYTTSIEVFDLETRVLSRKSITIDKSNVTSCFMPGINVGKYIYWFGGIKRTDTPSRLNSVNTVDYAQRYNIETGEFDFVTVGTHSGNSHNSTMLTNTELLFADWGRDTAIYKFKGAYELENGKLLIQEQLFDNIWQAVKVKDGMLSIGVNGVYLGGSDGYAQAKDAYLYDLTQQKWISLDGTPFGGG